ncbi:F-box protein CPR1-like [Rosa chinensis]|uniref:F-box protein CPR1-like n=1 Tax=Rosa chinensis TaxID=74649 RepID=UPI000D08D27F|nr:F-box protein CPR1-like [Rosa chinensis]
MVRFCRCIRLLQWFGGCGTRYSLTCLYIWNPSTGFRHKLPDPGFNSNENRCISYSGFGYLPATDDYKVLVVAATFNAYFSPGEEAAVEVMKIFSTRAGVWKSIESPFFKTFRPYFTSAALSGETLHWVPVEDICLYGFRYRYAACDPIKLWVMKDYGLEPEYEMLLFPFLATETIWYSCGEVDFAGLQDGNYKD